MNPLKNISDMLGGSSGIGGLLGGNSGLSNHTLDASQYAQLANQLGGANQPTWTSASTVKRDVPMGMVQSGDVIIRPVRNGYNVIVVRGMGMEVETYVATDADSLADVIKLAFVNKAMDAAK